MQKKTEVCIYMESGRTTFKKLEKSCQDRNF